MHQFSIQNMYRIQIVCGPALAVRAYPEKHRIRKKSDAKVVMYKSGANKAAIDEINGALAAQITLRQSNTLTSSSETTGQSHE
jgi:hypothetical protein